MYACFANSSVRVIFHNKSAKKKKMHIKPSAQFKFSLNKVVVGFLNIG